MFQASLAHQTSRFETLLLMSALIAYGVLHRTSTHSLQTFLSSSAERGCQWAPLHNLLLYSNRESEKYHPWFPILHQPSLLEILQTSPILSSTIQYIVFKAIAAVTLPQSYHTDSITNDQRQQCSDDLRSQVVMEAISHLSLQSLQAVLILTIRDFGAGRLSEFWNLVALAKRLTYLRAITC